MTKITITNPTVHTFDSTGEAYDASQTRDDIKDGDVLSVPSEKVVGILCEAWPVAVTKERGAFHSQNGNGVFDPAALARSFPDRDYTASVALAKATAAPTPAVLDRRDGSLDAFIMKYCAERGIRVDGDVFGVMFADHDLWTRDEAVAVIDRAAETWKLRLPKVGDRVRFRIAVGDYPINQIPAGSTGTVVAVVVEHPDRVEVLMDERFPDLAEWDNRFELYADNTFGDPTADDLATTFAKSAEVLKVGGAS